MPPLRSMPNTAHVGAAREPYRLDAPAITRSLIKETIP
ncbi:unnamed protein product [[Actinomadura] parvosata subsp. kistnae]|nr:unnamed protein product [Actinomadura parvosata subsp. kistnae]